MPPPIPRLSASTSPLGMLGYAHAKSEKQPLTCSSTDKADSIHAWLSRQLPDIPHPAIVRPINYVKIVTVTTAILGLITFFSVASPYILPVIQNRNLWAAVSLIMVLLFTSGHMFNHIRKVPYVQADGKGGVSYFAGGFQNQYGLETQIVAAMCKCCIFDLVHRRSANMLRRRHSLIRHHLPCAQGPTHDRPAQPADRGLRLGRRAPGHVLFPPQRLPDQERRVPVLAAAVLIGSRRSHLGSVRCRVHQKTGLRRRHVCNLYLSNRPWGDEQTFLWIQASFLTCTVRGSINTMVASTVAQLVSRRCDYRICHVYQNRSD